MAQSIEIKDILVILEEIRAQIAVLTGRVARLESGSKIQAQTAAIPKPAAPPAPVSTPVKQAITEEEILAVSAALGAYLGVRVHIRQMRLLSSSAWAQQGRVSVQAHIPAH